MNKVICFYLFLDIVFGSLIFYMPVEFEFVNGVVMYSYGPSANIVYIGSFISIALMVFCMIKNFKNLRSKKNFKNIRRKSLIENNKREKV